MSICPLCPGYRLQRVLSHHLHFVCLALSQKIRLFAPSAALGCGEPSPLKVQFWEAHQTARAPTGAYLFYGYHYFIYILLYI